LADFGYEITFLGDPKPPEIGMHGWDNLREEMSAIFFARGPSFKRKHQIPEMRNLEIYNVLCHILGLTPAPNNGSTVLPDILA
jgi:ectonucleotide pyrophosphatase/phosphodiesterase family protein 6